MPYFEPDLERVILRVMTSRLPLLVSLRFSPTGAAPALARADENRSAHRPMGPVEV